MRKSVHYYDITRRKGRKYSLAVHLVLLLLGIFGLPSFLVPRPPVEPMAISVDILPVSEMSNVKPSPTPPAEEPKPEEAKVTPKEAPPVITHEAEAVPPPPPPEKTKEQKPEKKPEPPPKPKEKPKPKVDDLAAILKAVKDTAQKQKAKDKQLDEADASKTKTKSDKYDASQPMSLSQMDAIRNQISKCWNLDPGARNAQDLIVTLHIDLAPDGSVLKVTLSDESQSRADKDGFFRAAADSARRAVLECSPLKNLPPEKYATWHDMEMTFNPKDMLN